MGLEPTNAEASVRACPNCKSLLTDNVVFCPDCGAYQGQPGVDEGGDPSSKAPTDLGNQTGTAPDGMRACTHCGLAVSTIATACTHCFRPLAPVAPTSGPELKRASPRLVWFLMGSGALIVLVYIVFEILDVVLSLHAAH